MKDESNEPFDPSAEPGAATRIGRPHSDRAFHEHDTEPQPPAQPSTARASGDLPALGTRYREGREIARGGMGRVVEATDIVLDRTVAVKEALGTDGDALRRFARETRITARLEHPSIVPVYDAGVAADGAPYYVMRKVSGRPLESLVFEKSALRDRLALLPHLVAAAQAVAHAHQRGVIHRDIKPSNILVGDLGETIVIDWGLAKVIGETDQISPVRRAPTSGDSLRTQMGAVLGTPGFMSPEQIESTDVDERADVYALGASLYYLLARRPPHAADTGDAMMLNALGGPPIPVDRIVRGVPRELASICDKALSFAPNKRYIHAGELAEELRQFLAGQLVASHRYSPRERAERFVRKHRALVITIGAAALLLAIGASFSISRILSARDEAVSQAAAARDAQTREAARATDLVFSQARLLLESNQAAAALALVRPLAGTERWRAVRAIGAGARAIGVPWRLPSSRETTNLAFSPDGGRAVSCGIDGMIRLHDLTAYHEPGSTREIARMSGRAVAVFIDDQRIAIARERTIWIHDLRGTAQVKLDLPTKIRSLTAAHGTIYGTDEARHAWRLDPGAAAATPLAIDDEIEKIEIAPAPGRVALAGKHALWLIDGVQPPERLVEDPMFDVSWDLAAPRLLAMSTKEMIDITFEPVRQIRRFAEGNGAGVIARGLRHTTGHNGRRFEGRALMPSIDWGTALAGLRITRGDFVVHITPTSLGIADGGALHEISLPSQPTAFAASPRSPYILAATRDLLLLWNVDDFMPRRMPVPAYPQIGRVGAHDVVTTSFGGPSKWLDTVAGTTYDLPQLEPAHLASSPSSATLLAIPIGKQHENDPGLLLWRGGTAPMPFPVAHANFADENRIVYITAAGALGIYDRATRKNTPLATFAGGARYMRLAARWLGIATRNDRLIRYDLVTRQSTETRFVKGDAFTTPDATGRIWISIQDRIKLWRTDGVLEDVRLPSALPAPIHNLVLLSDARALVDCTDGSTYIVSLSDPARPVEPTYELGRAWEYSDKAGLLAVGDRKRGMQIVDLTANVSWRIALSFPPHGSDWPKLSQDGLVVATRTSDDREPPVEDRPATQSAVLVWPLALPTTAEETVRWVERLTNAEYDPRLGKLSWR